MIDVIQVEDRLVRLLVGHPLEVVPVPHERPGALILLRLSTSCEVVRVARDEKASKRPERRVLGERGTGDVRSDEVAVERL
jgi:hypothetical protein